MAQKLRSLLTTGSVKDENKQEEPQLGFQVKFCESTCELKVKVIGAKQLPTTYGNSKARGYTTKVTVFPKKDKFETAVVEQSWPTFDEEFTFKLERSGRYEDCLKGQFISFTVYALLIGDDSTQQKKNIFSKLFSIGRSDNSFKRSRSSFRHSLNGRRTVGTVTHYLGMNFFPLKISSTIIGTPEIWRQLRVISSGLKNSIKETKRLTVEVTMTYNVSETGIDDTVEISVSKLRCNVKTMQEHEKLKSNLYIKMSALEYDGILQKIKSQSFDPTISLKLEKNTARLKVKVNKFNLNQLKISIRLLSKPIMKQKIELGRVEINHESELWREVMNSPTMPITKIINME